MSSPFRQRGLKGGFWEYSPSLCPQPPPHPGPPWQLPGCRVEASCPPRPRFQRGTQAAGQAFAATTFLPGRVPASGSSSGVTEQTQVFPSGAQPAKSWEWPKLGGGEGIGACSSAWTTCPRVPSTPPSVQHRFLLQMWVSSHPSSSLVSTGGRQGAAKPGDLLPTWAVQTERDVVTSESSAGPRPRPALQGAD